MAYVPLGREIFPALGVTDNLLMGLVKTGQQGIDRLMADFPRLKPLLDRAGGSLSGGEQQLLAQASALTSQPSLPLLGEPTEGIQPSIIEEIGETLAALRDRMQLTIVLAEQNLEFIAPVTQRVRVIKRGQLGEEIPRGHLGNLAITSEFATVHG